VTVRVRTRRSGITHGCARGCSATRMQPAQPCSTVVPCWRTPCCAGYMPDKYYRTVLTAILRQRRGRRFFITVLRSSYTTCKVGALQRNGFVIGNGSDSNAMAPPVQAPLLGLLCCVPSDAGPVLNSQLCSDRRSSRHLQYISARYAASLCTVGMHVVCLPLPEQNRLFVVTVTRSSAGSHDSKLASGETPHRCWAARTSP
jgi:hypothetical protein